MGLVRRLVSAIVLVAAIIVLIGCFIDFSWGVFGDVFKGFTFTKLVDAILLFFDATGNAIILTIVSLMGLTIPTRMK